MLGKIFRRRSAEKSLETSSELAEDHPQPIADIMRRVYGRITAPESEARDAIIRNVVAYRASQWLAQAVASLPLTYYDGDRVLDDDHAIVRLLHRPNVLQSGDDFFELSVLYLLLRGDLYWLGRGAFDGRVPDELWPLHPQYMEIRWNHAQNIPKDYRATINATREIFPLDPVTGACDVMHLPLPNPAAAAGWHGMPPSYPASIPIALHKAGAEWNYNLMQQGGRPMGGIAVEEVLTESTFQRMREELDQMWGKQGAGRPALLEGGAKWLAIGHSPTDMDWLKGHEVAARETAIAYGVPPQLIGLPGSQTYANYREARMAGYEDAVVPLGERLCESINRWLAPLFGDRVSVAVDLDGVEALAPKREARWDRIEKSSVLTINEKREEMGYGPVDGGDEIYTNPNRVPLSMAGYMGMPDESDGTQETRSIAEQLQAGDMDEAQAAEALAEALGVSEEVAEGLVDELIQEMPRNVRSFPRRRYG